MAYFPERNRKRMTLGEDGNSLVGLIALQLIVFVLLAFIKVIYYFSYSQAGLEFFTRHILDYVTLPADLSVFITRPWTLITHFITHDGVWHLIANLLWLWAFGYILQDLTGNRKLVPLFIYGALAGAFAYMLAYNLLPGLKANLPHAKALGSSAGVMAVAIGTTVIAPTYRIFPMINGGIPLWIITVLFAIIDLATIPYNNPGGHIAHLAGAAMGFIVMKQFQRGRDWTNWMNDVYDWMNNLFNPDKPAKGKSTKDQLFYKAKVAPFNKRNNISQQRIDEILEKIHQKGYQTLTEEERELLKRASKEDL